MMIAKHSSICMFSKAMTLSLVHGMLIFFLFSESFDVIDPWNRLCVWGSLVSTLVAVIPLADEALHFFHIEDQTTIAAFSDVSTWLLVLFSSICYMTGSLLFVRAFQIPSKAPLCTSISFLCTDELIGAWFCLFASLPAFPYCLNYAISDPGNIVYICLTICSFLLVFASAGFVFTCTPHYRRMKVRTRNNLHRNKKINKLFYAKPAVAWMHAEI